MNLFNRWIKKIHIYLGLLNLSILLVFGIAGLKATFRSPGAHKPAEPVVRFESYVAPPSVIDDKELAEHIRRRLNIADVGHDARRDNESNLRVNYYTHRGPQRVTFLEKENRLRVAVERESIWAFFDNLHATANRHPNDWRVKLWSWYNEFSVWSLIAMSLSGAYLWLSSRPNLRWAQVTFAAGSGALIVLYLFSR